MAKNNVTQYDTTAANNTDVGGISIAEGMSPSNVNNAMRELMKQTADWVSGSQAITKLTTTGTVEPGGDTAAGTNAAIGYTASEGLILTGQGSTSDLTVKNDADETVFTVPTGTDDVVFPDSAQLQFGGGSDLRLTHDGSNSYIIDQGTGGLYIQGDTFAHIGSPSGETGLAYTKDGAVDLYHDNVKKLATTSGGVEVTGVMDADNFKVNGAQGSDGEVLTSTGSGVAWEAAGGGGAWNLIGTQTADDSASLTQTGIDATYATYAIILEDFHPDTNNAAIIFRMGTSAGIDSTWGHYDWMASNGYDIASDDYSGVNRSYVTDNSDSGIKISGSAISLGIESGEGLCCVAYLQNARGTSMYPSLHGRGYAVDQYSSTGQDCEFFGHRTSMITTDRISVEFEGSINIVTGRLTVWGIAHA